MDVSSADFSSTVKCITYGGGIITMLGLYGFIQERIMTESYDGVLFKTTVFLVLCNRLVGILYAGTMIWSKGEEFGAVAPLWKYLAISLSNVAATWCQYEALKHVSFPVQMLGKSFKMMPVMVWSIVISQKKYGMKDWLIALGVTWGVTQFLLTGEIKAKHASAESSIYGLILLLAFLALDGFTSTFQEKLFKDHKTSKYNQMLYVNSGSAFVSIFSLTVSGTVPHAISFCLRHPDFVVHAMSLSGAAVAGQFFIYSQVREFGALTLAATMNLRQVLSILVSYLFYVHPITLLQFIGLVFVFSALFYKSYDGFMNQSPKPQKAEHPRDMSPAPMELGQAAEMKEDAETQPEAQITWHAADDPKRPA